MTTREMSCKAFIKGEQAVPLAREPSSSLNEERNQHESCATRVEPVSNAMSLGSNVGAAVTPLLRSVSPCFRQRRREPRPH